MKTTSLSDFRKDITIYLDTVSKEGETLIVEQGKKRRRCINAIDRIQFIDDN